MKLIGNKDTWKQLIKDMPSVAVLSGPRGVGKATGLELISERIARVDTNRLTSLSLLADDADGVVEWLSRKTTGHKIAIIAPEVSSNAGWGKLLKTLEELPDLTHVWIVDYGNTPPAIVNRAFRYRFSELTDQELELMKKTEYTFTVSPVINWLDAIEKGSREDLYRSVSGWRATHTASLLKEFEMQLEDKSQFDRSLATISKPVILECISFCRLEGPDSLKALTSGLLMLRNL